MSQGKKETMMYEAKNSFILKRKNSIISASDSPENTPQNFNVVANKFGAYVQSYALHSMLGKVTEEFLLCLLASMYLIGRYDFLGKLLEETGCNIDLSDPITLSRLGFSSNFLGNFWRLTVLFQLKETGKTDEKIMNMVAKLKLAEEYFKNDSEN